MGASVSRAGGDVHLFRDGYPAGLTVQDVTGKRWFLENIRSRGKRVLLLATSETGELRQVWVWATRFQRSHRNAFRRAGIEFGSSLPYFAPIVWVER